MRWTRRSLGALCRRRGRLAGAGGGHRRRGGEPVAHAGGGIDFVRARSSTSRAWDPGRPRTQTPRMLSAIYDINAGRRGARRARRTTSSVDTKSDPADGVLALDRALAVNHIVAEQGRARSRPRRSCRSSQRAQDHHAVRVRQSRVRPHHRPVLLARHPARSGRRRDDGARRASSSATRAWRPCSAPTPVRRATCPAFSAESRRRSSSSSRTSG